MDEYFERLEIKEGKPLDVKRVYVASDDAKVLSECRRKFPGKKDNLNNVIKSTT